MKCPQGLDMTFFTRKQDNFFAFFLQLEKDLLLLHDYRRRCVLLFNVLYKNIDTFVLFSLQNYY